MLKMHNSFSKSDLFGQPWISIEKDFPKKLKLTKLYQKAIFELETEVDNQPGWASYAVSICTRILKYRVWKIKFD